MIFGLFSREVDTAAPRSMISIRFRSVRGRKPTAMYTALVAQQDGEYRYVNSRLLTNAQGSALTLFLPARCTICPVPVWSLSRFDRILLSLIRKPNASRWKNNNHEIFQSPGTCVLASDAPRTLPSDVLRDCVLQGQREGEAGAAGGVREAGVDHETVRALPPLPRSIGLCSGQVLRHHCGVDGRVAPFRKQGPPATRQQHAGRGLSR